MYLLANHLLGGRRRKRGGGGNKVRVLVIAICLLTAPSLLVHAENLAEQKLRKQGPPNDVDAREGTNFVHQLTGSVEEKPIRRVIHRAIVCVPVFVKLYSRPSR